jgi:hypothetical protein
LNIHLFLLFQVPEIKEPYESHKLVSHNTDDQKSLENDFKEIQEARNIEKIRDADILIIFIILESKTMVV